MTSPLQKLRWWRQRRRREEDLGEELQFHLDEDTDERRAQGLSPDCAILAARRDLGNTTLVREEARALWSWVLLEQLAQDVRYAVRGMDKNRMFTALATLTLALGIGANTAIFSFMDAILVRSLPVADPASLAVVKWRSPAPTFGNGAEFVMHSIDGSTYDDGPGTVAAIFPFPAFERLRTASAPVMSALFAYKNGGIVNVTVDGAAELAQGEYVSGDFFRGLEVMPAAGRLIQSGDDRDAAGAVAVLSLGYSERRFGDAAAAVGRSILVNNAPFTVIGVAPSEFFGVDPAVSPKIYLPMHATVPQRSEDRSAFGDDNYYWVEMMGRVKPGVSMTQAQTALAGPFTLWVAATAASDGERANLPVLRLEAGAAGLDSLRRQYSKPLYVLFAMAGLILAIACANTANLLLARASSRAREIAVRLSLGAGRGRIVRQLLTESVLLAALGGALGIAVAVAGIRALTRLLANGQAGFTLHAEVNWHLLLVTLALSVACGVLFGLAPALHATRTALMTRLRDRSVTDAGARLMAVLPRLTASQALVIAQIATSLLLLVAAGLFVRTLSNLQSIPLGFNRSNLLLFDLNAPQAGYPPERVADFYGSLRRRLSDLPGVTSATLSHASIIRAGRSHPITVDGRPAERARILWAGPRYFQTMQIPILRGRDIAESDRQGSQPVTVVSELFAKMNFGDAEPVGRHIMIEGGMRVAGRPLDLEIIGVAADARYGGLKRDVPPVVYVPFAQIPVPRLLGQMTYELRTIDAPLLHADAIRQIVREADARVPVTNLKTQAEDIDQTINQEIVFARLCSAFAILALTIACVGLYATMAYAVARRTSEIGLRMALGAERRTVTWMVLRDVCMLAGVGLTIGGAAALATSRFVESFLYRTKPNDPLALGTAVAILLSAALAAGYGPARRASRVDPMVALRHE